MILKSLSELANDVLRSNRTDLPNYQVLDKNLGVTGHCYIDEVYETLFAPYRLSTKKVLEIGVHNGGSMLLWQSYFPNAKIQGLDNTLSLFFWKQHDRIQLKKCDAYTTETVNELDNGYDIIIDDGPHTLDSMRFFIKHYLLKLNINGIAVIEDIPDSAWIKTLLDDLSPNGMRTRIQVFDLRNINMRYDDMVLVIQKIG